MPEFARSRIGTLSLHSQVSDTPALRMNMARVFAGLDLRPAGMSPTAILCIERLAGTVPPDTLALGNAARTARSCWLAELSERLDEAYQGAARPVAGRLSVAAEAVLFRDQAELLACLCMDVLDGVVERKWWWRQRAGLFRSLSRSAALRSALLESPHSLGPVFLHLANWQRALDLAAVLGDADADELTAALLAAHNCAIVFEDPGEPGGHEGRSGQAAAGVEWEPPGPVRADSWFRDGSDRRFLDHASRRRGAPVGLPRSGSTGPPWLTLFPSQCWSARLSRSQACLLGLARTAAEHTRLLQNPAFTNQVSAWWAETDARASGLDCEAGEDVMPRELDIAATAGHDDRALAGGGSPDGQERRAVSTEGESIAQTPQRVQEHALDDEHDGPVERDSGTGQRAGDGDRHPAAAEAVSSGEATTPTLDRGSADNNRPDVPAVDASNREPSGPNPSAETAASLVTAPEAESVHAVAVDEAPGWLTDQFVDTGLGGVLYLLNVLEQLELPQRFELEWHLETRLGPWGFLEFLAVALLGDHAQSWQDDPVWELLAHLAGRDRRERIGENLLRQARTAYRLPEAWWSYYREQVGAVGAVHWTESNTGFRAWCDALPLLDIPADVYETRSEPLLRGELDRLLRPGPGRELLDFEGSSEPAPWTGVPQPGHGHFAEPLARWASLALPFVRFYLERQLQLDGWAGDQAVNSLLVLPARICFTRSHIDLVADVNLTSLSIRRAGFDQDPGWQPRFGRVVQFHFSQV